MFRQTRVIDHFSQPNHYILYDDSTCWWPKWWFLYPVLHVYTILFSSCWQADKDTWVQCISSWCQIIQHLEQSTIIIRKERLSVRLDVSRCFDASHKCMNLPALLHHTSSLCSALQTTWCMMSQPAFFSINTTNSLLLNIDLKRWPSMLYS